MKSNLLLAALFSLMTFSCYTSRPFAPRYEITNSFYKQKVDTLSAILKDFPLSDSISMALPYWVGTVNFNLRKPNFVILHHTHQDNFIITLNTFTNIKKSVSAHYLITKDGRIFHMLNDYLRAWHAGLGKWAGTTDVNSSSIGIELDNNGNEPFPDVQINALLPLLKYLKKKYNIPTQNFIGHLDIAPSRKVDPSIFFPWKVLADSGYGHWYHDIENVKLSSSFNPMDALRIIGYSSIDSNATIRSFKQHFRQDTTNSNLSDEDKKAIFILYKKY